MSKMICGGYSKEGSREKIIVELYFEDENEYDQNAIRVDSAGRTIGYLSRNNAKKYRAKMKKRDGDDVTISCNAIVIGGKKNGFLSNTKFGVWLDLSLRNL